MDHKQSVKEVIRHLLFRTGLSQSLVSARQRRGYKVAHLEKTTNAERFSAIYELGIWRHTEEQDSSSGLGSTISATADVVAELPALLSSLNCKRLLDIGCGDWNWMRNVNLPCEYLGIDIVPALIEANKKYERDGVSFAVIDSVQGVLPQADVALCREILFHLSFKDAATALANIQSASSWLVATTDTSIWFNSDIATGDYRKVNLERHPYNFPKPQRIIRDEAVSNGRVLGLWRTVDLRR
ncbi:MAG: class I SAM-dependent methyltransferase [Acidobacteriota bacterium]|nr:class I SAM-dependent methyltransferase [Acidobacteriota bacterium]